MEPVPGARGAYEQRAAAARAKLAELDQTGAWLGNLRAFAFLGLAISLGLVVYGKVDKVWALGSVGAGLAFIALVARHAKVVEAEARERVRLVLNERGLARLNAAWHAFPETGARFQPAEHPYAADLDVLGQGSLFQRLDETGTEPGARELAALLCAPPPSLEDGRARQVAVRELAGKLDFRQRLVTEARLANAERVDPSRLIGWVEGPSLVRGLRWAWPVAHVMPLVTLAVGVAALLTIVPPAAFWGLVIAQAAIVGLTRKATTAQYEAVSVGERGLVRFDDTFRAIAAEPFESPVLRGLQRGLALEGATVPERLGRFTRLMGFAQLRQSGLLHPILDTLLLWDVHVLLRLEQWREGEGRGLRGWFEALAQLEALSSCATLPFEEPTWAWPELVEGPFRLEATGLGHPLLAQAVRNDVTLAGPGHAWVITGSNMSGKTTLLRAVGLDMVMAWAGLPVCATRFVVGRAAVGTSMRVKDSLERGVSYFYAEVQRVKSLLQLAKANPSACLFLVDELFLGTNARERQVASLAIVRGLLDAGAAGGLTTHDLTLCALEQERPGQVRNVHFRDQEVGGEMTFDYRLHEGVVTTSNALAVLRRAGIDVG